MILLLTENPVGILYLGAGALTLTCAYVEYAAGFCSLQSVDFHSPGDPQRSDHIPLYCLQGSLLMFVHSGGHGGFGFGDDGFHEFVDAGFEAGFGECPVGVESCLHCGD